MWRHFLLDFCIEIHFCLRSIDFNDQGEARHAPLRVHIAIFLPPAPNRIDSKNATSGKVAGGDRQRIDMQGPNAPAVIAKIPLATVRAVVVLLVFNCRAANTMGERIDLFIRAFQRKTKAMRRISVLSTTSDF